MVSFADALMFLEGLMIFDLWLLIKVRRFIKLTFQSIVPIFKVVFFMTAGAGFLLAHALMQSRFDINSNKGGYFQSKKTELPSEYLEICDSTELNLDIMEKELIKIKNETLNLERSLIKMNIQLRHLHDRLKIMDLNLADFASEAAGGLVIDTPETSPYYNPNAPQITFFGIPVGKPNHFSPRKVIQPWSQAGECWAFQGSQGKVEIELAYAIKIDRVSLEHIPISASLTGNINSAPKMFNVLGKVQDKYVMIGTFMYKNNGLSSQMFQVKQSELTKTPFKRVMLDIVSNWGNAEYTCIYRFKVHGIIYNILDVGTNMKVQ
ncbi:hypothetical protein QAD02_006635 [Eretmocerus hayati]|uniref:Uncharacterized protein n=1 Tax=Eretmocerus hayati TaxID=131215 RepID=A0ACC2N1H8_9HYME|nr:hypothetical protein QAD02_006635 [Eretmocerus hayati]